MSALWDYRESASRVYCESASRLFSTVGLPLGIHRVTPCGFKWLRPWEFQSQSVGISASQLLEFQLVRPWGFQRVGDPSESAPRYFTEPVLPVSASQSLKFPQCISIGGRFITCGKTL